jgi:hypothetical protein
MRSIRVGGHTHCWVVETFEREQERAFSSLRRGHFCRARACIPRLLTSTEIEARGSTYTGGRTTRFRGPYSLLCAQKSRNRQHLILSVRYRFISPYSPYFGTVFEEGQSVVHRPYRTDSTGTQSLLGTEIEAGCCVGFLESLARFPRRPYNH